MRIHNVETCKVAIALCMKMNVKEMKIEDEEALKQDW